MASDVRSVAGNNALMPPPPRASRALTAFTLAGFLITAAPFAQQTLPSGPLVIRAFTLRFDPAGTFTLSGDGWTSMAGTWTTSSREVALQLQNGPKDCTGAGRYTFSVDGERVSFNLIADACQPRRMLLDRSQWLPPGVQPAMEARRIVRGGGTATSALPPPANGAGHWPSFRGHEAAGSADGQTLPDDWSPSTGTNVLWRTTIPGLAHSSPIVWGEMLFVTSAVSSRPDAAFKPGLYGDGDASDDRSAHRWILYAIDKRTGKVHWERTAAHGEPRNKRHIKSTYASSSPATNGRIVVAWFGSQGIFAYDFHGGFQWSVDLGRCRHGCLRHSVVRVGTR